MKRKIDSILKRKKVVGGNIKRMFNSTKPGQRYFKFNRPSDANQSAFTRPITAKEVKRMEKEDEINRFFRI